VDTLLSRFTDLIFAFPAFLLAVLCAEYFGNLLDNSPINQYMAGGGRVMILTIVFAAVGWPALMRFVRSLALSLKEQQFVEAARTSGSTSWRILVRHLLPNMYGLILVQAGFIVVGFISTEAVISILGLGVQPPNPDIGVMLAHGPEAFGFSYWLTIFPAIVLTILILAFTFLGDGVRDAVDPRGNK
jgi:peptide/nickel transport system permease protein